MFRLQDRQLHIMLLLIIITGGLFFFLFGVKDSPRLEGGQSVQQLGDFSDGWLYQKKDNTEIVSFPLSFDAKDGDSFLFYHRVPDMTNENVYLVFQTKRQPVQVKIDDFVIYESDLQDNRLESYHVVPILPEYHNRSIVLVFNRENQTSLEVPKIYVGNKLQLYGQIARDNMREIIWGLLLILVCICMLVTYGFIKNRDVAKNGLLYGSLQGLVIGLLSILQGSFLPLITGWNYGIYMVKICLIVILAMLHLLVCRCFTYKKRVISLLDIGSLLYLIYFISIMVFQFFGLVRLDTVYTVSKCLYVVTVIGCTVAFCVTVVDYNRQESKPVLYANITLLAGIIIQVVMTVVGRDISFNDIFLPVGITVYELFILVVGLKKALYVKPKEIELPYSEEEVRKNIIEQINPNLLFASLHTLQSLIKSGSSNSVKMIYYFSVYLRNNLKAMESQGSTIPFSEELEHILAYLQLQKTRNGNLKFAIECKVTDFQIPRHSIEPLVENAVKHGISAKNNAGNIVVRTYMRAEGYAIQIIDDGIGFDKKKLKNKSNTSVLRLFSILENACKAQTEIISHEGKGTVITIILPMLDNDLMEAGEEDINVY